MFDALSGLGYRVIPQVRAGNFRIDLVIEGHRGKRLAVECDGDQYHGPDKWMDDMSRQRLLERAGWKFWRCWGASFARDKDSCINDLVNTLAGEGIGPVGEEQLDFSGIVEFREIGTAGEEELDLEDIGGSPDELTEAEVPEPQTAVAEAASHDMPVRPVALTRREPDLFEGDFSDLPLYRQNKSSRPLRTPKPTISIGDAVRYQVTDYNAAKRKEYIMILNQPSNWKLGIVSSDEAIAKCLLGRTQGEKFKADIDGSWVEIEIVMKHEVSV